MCVLLIAGLPACGGDGGAPPEDPNQVVIAAFDFPESVLLAEVYGQALEARGIDVRRELGLGPREVVEPALEQGLVDLVPEYGGSSLEFVTLGKVEPTADGDRTHEELRHALGPRGIAVLDASPAEDRNGMAVTATTAARFGLRTISDLAPHAADMVLAGPLECADRPRCLPGLERVYGLRFERFLPI